MLTRLCVHLPPFHFHATKLVYGFLALAVQVVRVSKALKGFEMRKYSALLALASIALSPFASQGQQRRPGTPGASSFPTSTPIKHLVVIFDENISFDHYFGAYPDAANPPGEPTFRALPGTPAVNGLTSTLLKANPDSAAPFRLDRSEAVTCDNDNHYTDEQKAYNGGLIDQLSELLSGLHAQSFHGLLRRQHRHGPMELRPALCDER
jgi:phospholipase C